MILEFIKEQMTWVDSWTLELIADLDERYWRVDPYLQTSINWQVGHIIISKYFHSMESILDSTDGTIQKARQDLPTDDFFKYYFAGSDPMQNWDNRPNSEILLESFRWMTAEGKKNLETMVENTLHEETEVPNPVAVTKYDALTFAFKHQMWHCGQIAMIHRIIRRTD